MIYFASFSHTASHIYDVMTYKLTQLNWVWSVTVVHAVNVSTTRRRVELSSVRGLTMQRKWSLDLAWRMKITPTYSRRLKCVWRKKYKDTLDRAGHKMRIRKYTVVCWRIKFCTYILRHQIYSHSWCCGWLCPGDELFALPLSAAWSCRLSISQPSAAEHFRLTWNALREEVISSSILRSFRQRLKTLLFQRSFSS